MLVPATRSQATVSGLRSLRAAKSISGKYLLDNAVTIGCLVELGFMSNENDLNILISNDLLEYRCLMIYLGILKYLEYN
jgi:N-acetylmuramoyl-L-alanine amidase